MMSISVHRGPVGETGRGLMLRGLGETDEGYVEKALEMGIFPIGAPTGNLEGGSRNRASLSLSLSEGAL